MKKKPGLITVLLTLTCLICIGSLFYVSWNTYQQILTTEKDMEGTLTQMNVQKQAIQKNQALYTELITQKQENAELRQRISSKKVPETERDPAAQDEINDSVFSQSEATGGQDVEDDTFSAGEAAISESSSTGTFSGNGHVVCIDPGHQGYNVDMSAKEPSGPGSTVMKAKASTGTEGSYTGLPEYQLNLDVSLKLKEDLESRGYQVVMTRTDNDTAISNKERAEFASAEGAEISVRIHANGEDTHTATGALTMAPSASNPYVSQLSEASQDLAQKILDSYCAATGFPNLGVMESDDMTGVNWSTIPVTIVEMGFMSNQSDDTRMSDPSFQDTMAKGIADGIDAYFRS